MDNTSSIFIGNLTADPEQRWTNTQVPVAHLRIAHTPRIFDRASNTWTDGKPVFMNVHAWKRLGENAAETLRKGDRVIIAGTLEQSPYTDRDGHPREGYAINAIAIGPDLRYATANITRNPSGSGRASSEHADAPGWVTGGDQP